MEPQDVADYLRAHPAFFDEHEDLIGDLVVPHPHGGHAIPIAERQILALRDKNAELETKLRELVAYGNENDAVAEKLHRLTLALFAASSLEAVLAVLQHSLTEDFGVPHVAVRLWGKVPEQSYQIEFAAVSVETRDYANALGAPYCGPEPVLEAREWFEDEADLASYAYVPLRTTDSTFGLLSLASPDPARFQTGMGTVHLARIAELASVVAARFLLVS
jgi:uncharacterized protein YigA (DUF484 family)